MENRKLTDKQNEVFSQLFGALKSKGHAFKVEAHTLIEFDDENFTKVYTDTDCSIVGSDAEIQLVQSRAKYLDIKEG